MIEPCIKRIRLDLASNRFEKIGGAIKDVSAIWDRSKLTPTRYRHKVIYEGEKKIIVVNEDNHEILRQMKEGDKFLFERIYLGKQLKEIRITK